MLSALEIIDSLKESIKKADENKSDVNSEKARNPSLGVNIIDENLNNNNPNIMNSTYDQQIVLTEKDYNQSNFKYPKNNSNKINSNNKKEYNDSMINNKSTVPGFNYDKDLIKNIQTIRTNNYNFNCIGNENNTIINTTIETSENNIVNMNNTVDLKGNRDKSSTNNNNYEEEFGNTKNAKTTTNRKNIQINIPEGINQFSVPNDKLMNVNLYSNKGNIVKNFNINNSNNLKFNQYSQNECNKNNIESETKYSSSKSKIQNINNNITSHYSKENINKISVSNSKYNSNNNYSNSNQKQLNNNRFNFQDTVNNIKNSIMTGMSSSKNFGVISPSGESKKNYENQNLGNFSNVYNKSNSKVFLL